MASLKKPFSSTKENAKVAPPLKSSLKGGGAASATAKAKSTLKDDIKNNNKVGAVKREDSNNIKSSATAAAATDSSAGVPAKKKIVIPYVLPWESRPAIQNQHGMKAFGTGRNVFTRVNTGSKEMPTDRSLKSESTLTLLSDNINLATQKGMRIGAFRDNVTRTFSSKETDKEKFRACEGIIPRQSGFNDVPSQAGETPMGALRRNVPKVRFKESMSDSMDPESRAFISKFMAPNPNCHAGTTVMDKMRKQVPEIQGMGRKGHDRKTEAVLPRFQVRDGLDTCRGTGAGTHGLGPFRQVVTPVTGGYKFTEDEIIASKKAMPWATSASLTSQQGTGGFQKHRDVVSNVKYRF